MGCFFFRKKVNGVVFLRKDTTQIETSGPKRKKEKPRKKKKKEGGYFCQVRVEPKDTIGV